MALKYFLFAFVALFALQGIVESKSVDAETYALSDTFKAIIDQILKLIKDTVNTIVGELEAIIKQVLASGNVIIGKADETIKEIVGGALKGIDELVAKAEALGCDVTECLANNKEALENIPKDTVTQLTKCVDDQIVKANTIVENTLKLVQDIVAEITVLEKEFVDCRLSLLCMTGVIGKATTALAKLPGRLGSIAANAVKVINGLVNDITVCSATTVTNTVDKAADLTVTITKCIQGKIDEVVTTIVSV